MGRNPEDLPEAMDDRVRWRERFWDIRDDDDDDDDESYLRHNSPSPDDICSGRVNDEPHLCDFQVIHGVKQCTSCQLINYHDTFNKSEFLLRPELLQLYNICNTNKHGRKYCKTFHPSYYKEIFLFV